MLSAASARAFAVFAALSAALSAILFAASCSHAPRAVVSSRSHTPRSASASPSLAPPSVVAVAYLGDLAVASPVRSPRGGRWSISLRFRRHYSASLGPPCPVPVGRSPVSAFTVALDYRAETLLVWAAPSGVFARVLPAAGASGTVGAPGPVFKLAALAPASVAEVAAVFSDDAHAIVAWRSFSVAPSGARVTSIELGLLRVRAPAPPPPSRTPLLVERFRDPPSLPSLDGSLRVVRLPSEAVRLTWPGFERGRLVVRSSPVSLRRGAYAPAVVSPTSPSPPATVGSPAAGAPRP
jgi:hypothetical protein